MSSFGDSYYTRASFFRPTHFEHEVVTWGSILTTAGSRLPLLKIERSSHIGEGKTFSVGRVGQILTEAYLWGEPGLVQPNPTVLAVKHIRQERLDDRNVRVQIMREIQILTHPPLRKHPSFLAILGYGWRKEYSDTSFETIIGARGNLYTLPYLAMQYAAKGTLRDYCRAITNELSTISKWRKLQLLALDVAAGIAALHECGIVHGDVKGDNVLVVTSEYSKENFVATLADFGASLFEDEVKLGASYKGTPIYNAPELNGIEEWPEYELEETTDFIETPHARADVYSYGLLFWELLNGGDCYINDDLLLRHEQDNKIEFLHRIYNDKKEAISDSAQTFVTQLDIDEPFRDAALTVVRRSLRRAAPERCAAKDIVDTLYTEEPNRKGSSLSCNLVRSTLLGRSIATNNSKKAKDNTLSELDNLTLDEKMYRTKLENHPGFTVSLNDLWLQHSSPYSAKQQPSSTSDGGNMLVQISSKVSSAQSTIQSHVTEMNVSQAGNTSSPQIPQAEENKLQIVPSATVSVPDSLYVNMRLQPPVSDAFTMVRITGTPWEVQKMVVEEFLEEIRCKESSLYQVAECHFQLSVCYYAGFGVAPSVSSTLDHMRMACENSPIAAEIHKAIEPVLAKSSSTVDQAMEFVPSDFSARLREFHRKKSVAERSYPFLRDHQDYTLEDKGALKEMIRQHSWGRSYSPFYVHVQVPFPDTHLEKTLLFHHAAKAGDLTIIRTFMGRLSNTLDNISADDNYALALGLNLACEYGNFEVAKCLYRNGWCSYVPDGRGIFPLHWLFLFDGEEAEELGRLLCRGDQNRLDATPHFYTNDGKTVLSIPEFAVEFSGTPLHWAVRARSLHVVNILLSLGANVNSRVHGVGPLDIAVCFHFPEIVSLLLSHGAEFQDTETGLSALHNFRLAFPFSRIIIHGPSYRQSLRDTIKVLLDRGYSINIASKTGETPLLTACGSSIDEGVYIVEELLSFGANSQYRDRNDETIFAVSASVLNQRRFNVACLRFLIENVHNVDINARTSWGYTALHYCVVGDSIAGLRELLKHPGLSNSVCRNILLKDMTALHLAAYFGSLGCLQRLIAAKVPLEVNDANDATPLELAIINRNPLETNTLLNAGARFVFGDIINRRTYTTALHAGVANAATPTSMTRQLLQHHRIYKHKCVNYFDYTGETALHKAAYYGDINSVENLLDAGADPRLKSKEWAKNPNLTPQELVAFLLEKGELGDDHKRFESRSQTRWAHRFGWQGLKVLLEEVQIILEQYMDDMGQYVVVEDQSDTTSNRSFEAIP